MRTTLTLDDDLLQLVREEAARTRRTVRSVLNERLRLGFASPRRPRPGRAFVVEPFAGRGFAPGVDEARLNQLVDTLETESARR
jgi:hypothetical protein